MAAGLCPDPHCRGSLQRSPDPLAGFKGLLLRGGKRREWEKRAGVREGRKEWGRKGKCVIGFRGDGRHWTSSTVESLMPCHFPTTFTIALIAQDCLPGHRSIDRQLVAHRLTPSLWWEYAYPSGFSSGAMYQSSWRIVAQSPVCELNDVRSCVQRHRQHNRNQNT